MYLKSRVQALVGHFDLHQRDRLLTSLDEYDHLHRIFRLCIVHVFRNIRSCSVPEHVRVLMRSLVCILHEDWNGTIAHIQEDSGKAGNSMLMSYNYECTEYGHFLNN